MVSCRCIIRGRLRKSSSERCNRSAWRAAPSPSQPTCAAGQYSEQRRTWAGGQSANGSARNELASKINSGRRKLPYVRTQKQPTLDIASAMPSHIKHSCQSRPMKLLYVLLILLSAACVSYTPKQAQILVDSIKTPEGREHARAKCARTMSPENSALFASIMHVPKDQAMAEACRRFIAAIANDQITPKQLAEMATDPTTQAKRRWASCYERWRCQKTTQKQVKANLGLRPRPLRGLTRGTLQHNDRGLRSRWPCMMMAPGCFREVRPGPFSPARANFLELDAARDQGWILIFIGQEDREDASGHRGVSRIFRAGEPCLVVKIDRPIDLDACDRERAEVRSP